MLFHFSSILSSGKGGSLGVDSAEHSEGSTILVLDWLHHLALLPTVHMGSDFAESSTVLVSVFCV